MQVLTHEDFLKLKNSEPDKVKINDAPVAQSAPESQFEYFLFYPDNYRDNYYSGIYNIEYCGLIEKLEIINGVLKTDIPEIKDALIKKGFQFMYVKEKELNNG